MTLLRRVKINCGRIAAADQQEGASGFIYEHVVKPLRRIVQREFSFNLSRREQDSRYDQACIVSITGMVCEKTRSPDLQICS